MSITWEPQQVVDELTYQSYATQRRLFPQTTPARWRKIFDNAETMEKRFQKESQRNG